MPQEPRMEVSWCRRGPRLTAAQKAELWRRWREGESLRAKGSSKCRATVTQSNRCMGRDANVLQV